MKYAGRARAAVAVALALALFGPGPLVSPSPGGDEGSRSTQTPIELVMVNLNETTCLAPAPFDGVFTGTDGGGIAFWGPDGTLSALHTTADRGLDTNHIVDLERDIGVCLAIADTEEPTIYATGAIGYRWFDMATVDGATGPLRSLEGGGGEGFLVLDSLGAVFLSSAGGQWAQLHMPDGQPDAGWDTADRDGDTVVLANGTDVVVVVDLSTEETRTIPTPPVVDLDLDGDAMAVASPDHPDVFDLGTSTWLDQNVTEAIGDLGQEWALVTMQGSRLTAATLDGVVAGVNVSVPPSEAVELVGSLPEDLDADVTDVLPMANDTVLVSTLRGNWVLDGGEARPFASADVSMPPSNEMLSVSYAADTLWVLTPHGLSFLEFDSRNLPARWVDGPDLGEGAETGTMDTAHLSGRVYVCGYGAGIHTYDTYASSSASRWGRTHIYGDAHDDVTDLVVANGTLYAGGPFGLDRMVTGSDPPGFEPVPGSPAGILSLLHTTGDLIYVGTEQGHWSYDVVTSSWSGPGEVLDELPLGPVADMASSGNAHYSAIWDTVQATPHGGQPANVTFNDTVTRLASRPDVSDPVWCVADGRAFTIAGEQVPGPGGPQYAMVSRERERDRMGDARVNDVSLAPDGLLCLATDSGLHRIDRFGTSWSEWTTSNGLSANDIRTLAYVEQQSTLWVGAYGGVDVMDVPTHAITRIGVEDGIPSNQVYDIEMDGTDVWIGTDVGGAARADRDQLEWREYNTSTGLIADDVQAVAVRDDLVLFGTDEGVTVLDRGDSTLESYTSGSSALPGNWVWCALGHDTGFYVGTDSGLARFDPDDGTWQEYDVEGLAGVGVRSLEMTLSGDLWAGTDEGIFVLPRGEDMVPDERGMFVLGRDDGLPGEEVLSLRLTSENTMWVGTSAGAAVTDGVEGYPGLPPGVQATFTTRDGLVHDRVTAMEEGPDGTIWFGTAGGLSQLRRTDYRARTQWEETSADLPDVYITLADLVISPEEPVEGDDVTIEVTVTNPSGKRAIVHVGLFTDDGGAVGEELYSAIAYTEPGESFQVTLDWTAVGGEQSLWIVADPADLVPESNERNNVVALSLHVDYLPEILDLQVSSVTGSGAFPEQMVEVTFSFTYRDRDWDRLPSISVNHSGWPAPVPLTVPGGDLDEGIGMGGTAEVPLGNTTLHIEAFDGAVHVNESFTVHANFDVKVEGVENGRDDHGDLMFTVTTAGPWEGSSIEGVEVAFVEPGLDPHDTADWNAELFHPATGEGDEWVYDASDVEDGTYDVWVLAMDDRSIRAIHVEEDLEVETPDDDDGVDWYTWGFAIILILAIISIALAIIRGRQRP